MYAFEYVRLKGESEMMKRREGEKRSRRVSHHLKYDSSHASTQTRREREKRKCFLDDLLAPETTTTRIKEEKAKQGKVHA